MQETASGIDIIENRTYDEIAVGDSAMLVRTLRPEDIRMFATMAGEVNPAHVDPEYARSAQFREIAAHGMWGSAMIANLLGTQFPGPGTVMLSQNLRFAGEVRIGDTVTATVTCRRKSDHDGRVVFDCVCVNQDGTRVVDGEAEVAAPTEKIRRPRTSLPPLAPETTRRSRYEHLLSITRGLAPIAMAMVHPCDTESLRGAIMARDAGLEVWDRPSQPCLSSRIPYGTPVTMTTLSSIDRAVVLLDREGEAQAVALVEVRAREEHMVGGRPQVHVQDREVPERRPGGRARP